MDSGNRPSARPSRRRGFGGFFLGPFVYFGREKAWDYFGSGSQCGPQEPAPKLLPAPV